MVEDGILKAVEPDPGHPTGSALCVKGKAAPQLVHSPRRLLHPLKRTQPKGAADPGWTRIGWDEALDTIAEKLGVMAAREGPEAVAFGVTTPSGTAVSDGFAWISRLARAFGSPNLLFNTENCNWHKDFSPALTFGSGIGMPEYERTGCIVYWGFNPSTSWLAQAIEAKAAQRRGAALVAVDPRRAGLANSADQWLRVRPGADGILALALAHVLIERDWFDRGFLENYSNGPFLVRDDNGRLLTEADVRHCGSPARFVIRDSRSGNFRFVESATDSYAPALSGRFQVITQSGALDCRTAFDLYAQRCRAYPPERAEALTGVPAGQIVDTARLLHEKQPVSFFTWTGTAQHADATQVTRAVNLLYALTGDLDARGGNVQFTRPAVADLSGLDLLTDSQRAGCLGVAQRPLGPGTRGWINPRDLWRAVVEHHPYPVRALVSFGGDPLLTGARDPNARAALEKLELHVHADLFHNPTSAFADLVLPVASPWERSGLYTGFQISQAAESRVQLRPPVIAARGESRSDQAIVFDLARRLGLGGNFFGGDAEAALRHQLGRTGLTPEQLRAHPQGIDLKLNMQYRKYRERGFATPSGRLEIYSQQMLEYGYAPLPEFDAHTEAESKDYPLVLTCAKWVQYCHSQHHALPALRALMPEPLVEIHPLTAEARGIGAGDWMRVRTCLGRIKARARFNNKLDPNVVCAQYGWWEDCADLDLPAHEIEGPENASYNSCIDAGVFDPVSSSNSLRCWPCDVERCES